MTSSKQPLPRGIQHIGVTVPDLDAATEFLIQGLGAKVAYDGLTPDDEPRQGEACLLYTSDAADEGLGVDLGGRRIIKKNFFQAEDGIRDSP